MAFIGPYSIVISNGVKQNSSDVFNILDPDSGGSSTFSVPLSANGLEPATHWGARTMLQAETYTALTTMTTTQFKTFVDGKAQEFGRQPLGSITAFKNNVQIGGGDFWTFIASLGLKPVASAF